jgi:hypothetical protein
MQASGGEGLTDPDKLMDTDSTRGPRTPDGCGPPSPPRPVCHRQQPPPRCCHHRPSEILTASPRLTGALPFRHPQVIRQAVRAPGRSRCPQNIEPGRPQPRTRLQHLQAINRSHPASEGPKPIPELPDPRHHPDRHPATRSLLHLRLARVLAVQSRGTSGRPHGPSPQRVAPRCLDHEAPSSLVLWVRRTRSRRRHRPAPPRTRGHGSYPPADRRRAYPLAPAHDKTKRGQVLRAGIEPSWLVASEGWSAGLDATLRAGAGPLEYRLYSRALRRRHASRDRGSVHPPPLFPADIEHSLGGPETHQLLEDALHALYPDMSRRDAKEWRLALERVVRIDNKQNSSSTTDSAARCRPTSPQTSGTWYSGPSVARSGYGRNSEGWGPHGMPKRVPLRALPPTLRDLRSKNGGASRTRGEASAPQAAPQSDPPTEGARPAPTRPRHEAESPPREPGRARRTAAGPRPGLPQRAGCPEYEHKMHGSRGVVPSAGPSAHPKQQAPQTRQRAALGRLSVD